MLDEIKELVQLLNSLPHLALWVAAGFWAYKVIVIGSIYGLIRFTIDKTHDWLTKPRTVTTEYTVNGLAIVYPHSLATLMQRVISDTDKSGSHPRLFGSLAQGELEKAWDQYMANNPKK